MKQRIKDSLASSESPYPYDRRWLGLAHKWWILITLGIGAFMGTLDGSIVNTVLPVIRQSFGTDLSSIEWVVMAYLLVMSIFLLSFGRLGDILGYKRVYNIGLIVFTIGSILCGLSPTEGFLIGFRAFQAFGAAMISSNSPAILTATFLPKQRGQVLGMLAMITYLGITIGPSLGGYLADSLGWRYIFFLNLPVGIVAATMAFFIIPRLTSGQKREPFDLAGAGALTVGLGSLMLAISKGQDLGWTSPLIIGLIFVAVVFLFIFFRLEHVLPHPMLDLSLFRSRLFTAATISALLNYLCVFAGLFLVPFYLVQGRGFAPSLAGLLITAQPVAMVISAPISGYLSDRIGSRLLSTGGMVILAAGMFTLHGLGAESSAWQIVLPLALTGLGTGLFVSPNNSAILGSAPRHRQGITSGILATARNLGMVFGVAVSGAIFGMQMAQRSAGQAGSPTAFFGAFQDTFIVIAVIAIIGAATSLVRGPATPRTS